MASVLAMPEPEKVDAVFRNFLSDLSLFSPLVQKDRIIECIEGPLETAHALLASDGRMNELSEKTSVARIVGEETSTMELELLWRFENEMAPLLEHIGINVDKDVPALSILLQRGEITRKMLAYTTFSQAAPFYLHIAKWSADSFEYVLDNFLDEEIVFLQEKIGQVKDELTSLAEQKNAVRHSIESGDYLLQETPRKNDLEIRKESLEARISLAKERVYKDLIRGLTLVERQADEGSPYVVRRMDCEQRSYVLDKPILDGLRTLDEGSGISWEKIRAFCFNARSNKYEEETKAKYGNAKYSALSVLKKAVAEGQITADDLKILYGTLHRVNDILSDESLRDEPFIKLKYAALDQVNSEIDSEVQKGKQIAHERYVFLSSKDSSLSEEIKEKNIILKKIQRHLGLINHYISENRYA